MNPVDNRVDKYLLVHAKSNEKSVTFAQNYLRNNVVEIIVDKLGVKESEVVPEASFTNHLGADSLDTVELIMEFEKAFDIQIPDEDAEKIATVGDAITYIESHKK